MRKAIIEGHNVEANGVLEEHTQQGTEAWTIRIWKGITLEEWYHDFSCLESNELFVTPVRILSSHT